MHGFDKKKPGFVARDRYNKLVITPPGTIQVKMQKTNNPMFEP